MTCRISATVRVSNNVSALFCTSLPTSTLPFPCGSAVEGMRDGWLVNRDPASMLGRALPLVLAPFTPRLPFPLAWGTTEGVWIAILSYHPSRATRETDEPFAAWKLFSGSGASLRVSVQTDARGGAST